LHTAVLNDRDQLETLITGETHSNTTAKHYLCVKAPFKKKADYELDQACEAHAAAAAGAVGGVGVLAVAAVALKPALREHAIPTTSYYSYL
jgi:hypothetical protein